MYDDLSIRAMLPDDWEQVSLIYKQGIDTGNATFQQTIPTWEEWDKGHLKFCRISALLNEELVGWAALGKASDLFFYGAVDEVRVYVSTFHSGKKIGTHLMQALIKESEINGIWTLQAGIFPENTHSIRLHENVGFRVVGRREKIGKMNEVWRDTLLLERRSRIEFD